jgi:hypothetical protein
VARKLGVPAHSVRHAWKRYTSERKVAHSKAEYAIDHVGKVYYYK